LQYLQDEMEHLFQCPRGTSNKLFEMLNHILHMAHASHRWYALEEKEHGVNQLRVVGGVCNCCLEAAMQFCNGDGGGIVSSNSTSVDNNVIVAGNNNYENNMNTNNTINNDNNSYKKSWHSYASSFKNRNCRAIKNY